MISKAQHGRHNTEWKLVCQEYGWKLSDDVRRLAFYRQFKLPESRKDWHPRHDFDRFLDACLKIRGIHGGRDRERERLVWRVRVDAKAGGLDDAYLQKLSTDLYGLGCWDELALDDLTNFRNAIHLRASTHLGKDTRTAPKRRVVLDPEKTFRKAGMPNGEQTECPVHSVDAGSNPARPASLASTSADAENEPF